MRNPVKAAASSASGVSASCHLVNRLRTYLAALLCHGTTSKWRRFCSSSQDLRHLSLFGQITTESAENMTNSTTAMVITYAVIASDNSLSIHLSQ